MKDQFSQLVSKVLAGEASVDEKKSLQQMLLDSSENTLIYNQIKEYWNADVNLTQNRDNKTFEENLMAQLESEPKLQTSGFRKVYLRIASAAAILFFLATCSLAYLYTSVPRQLYTYSAQETPIEYLLKDGTKVTLNKNSSITFLSNYGDKRRDVKLNGEAFFKVTKDKTRPFSVEALGTRTEVLGTTFNVKSVQETGHVITTLVSGSVRYMAENCDELLKPGQEIDYNKNSRKFELQKIDTQYNTAWVSGRFSFNNLKFSELAEKLEHIYKLKIEIADSEIADRVVSASFLYDEPIEDILSALEEPLGFTCTIKDSTQINIVSKTLKNKMPM